ncbi:MAG: hypothetical protein A3H28_06620 [Acidobacteria bacterium RIFCSPLOWO2_02_FULL_61_28]|nr:MAG: hypothetical protein A3H28_06620 [Acidobacteria bacterium RIFCSPLOWO2_02_FULL_61_28]
MDPAATRMTYDQLRLLPDDRNRYELFDGELVMTPSPTPRHQQILVRLLARVWAHVQAYNLGEVFVAPLDIIFDQYTVLQPDILFVSRPRVPWVVKERIEGSPDLVVEILSPTTIEKDRFRKLALYSQFAVREYWIVDPDEQAIELYLRAGEELKWDRRFFSDETFESPLLAGFQLPVSSLFR